MNVADGCDKYKAQYGSWPSSLPQLQAWQPGLVDTYGKDAWGHVIILVPYDESLGYGQLIGYGHDGKPGGTGDDRDLVVRFPTEANAAWNEQERIGLKEPRSNP